MREMTLGQVASFSFELFKRRYNDDLANDLGNLLNRITILIRKFCNNHVPDIQNYDKIDEDLIDKIKILPNKSLKNIDNLKINMAIEEIMSVVRYINKYLELKEPWKILKTNNADQSGLNTLSIACEAIALSAKLLFPVMPSKCDEIFKILNIPSESRYNLKFGQISGNHIQKHNVLFPRIEDND